MFENNLNYVIYPCFIIKFILFDVSNFRGSKHFLASKGEQTSLRTASFNIKLFFKLI